MNSNNRSQVTVAVGAIAATAEKGLLYAHKKMIVRGVALVDITAVAASGTDYIQAQCLVNGTLVGTVADTQAGLAAREALPLVMPADGLTNNLGITLEKGEFLSIALTKAASGALTNASIHLDVEIVGN